VNKTASGIMIILFLIGSLSLVFNIQPVSAWTGTVYIRTDGSIDPVGAPIKTVDNVTYTLTDNITSSGDGIVVERNNTIIDGNGYTLQGTRPFAYDYNGINLAWTSNVTVTYMEIKGFNFGVNLLFSFNVTVSGTNITDNDIGVRLLYSSHITLFGNIFVGDGLRVYDSRDNSVIDNLVNGKPLVYLESVSDVVVEDAGQVILVNCNRIRAENLNVSNTTIGVELYNTNNTVISGNNIANNTYDGIEFDSSNHNVICGNNITNNSWAGIGFYQSSSNLICGNNITANYWYGVWLSLSLGNSIRGNNITANTYYGIQIYYFSNNNDVSGNTIAYNNCGIWVFTHSDHNSISRNNMASNSYGIWLYQSSDNNSICENDITANSGDGVSLGDSSNYNTIFGNNITANNEYGISLYQSSGNKIYHNNFADNTQQVGIDSSYFTNTWDDGYPSGGNYWSDYTGTDADGDGIGDTPYTIDANNKDNYPLMCPYPFIPGDINHDGIVNINDATLIGWYWQQTVPPAPTNVDINGDGIINVLDATIVRWNWQKHA
jgi:parallel beta-helix repeat protein